MNIGKSILNIFQKIKTTGNTDAYYLLAFFFVLTFGYFYWVADYILFFQERQSLFVFSKEYLEEYLLKPGGLLEYASIFLTQFSFNAFNGSLILAFILTLPGFIILKINNRLILSRSFSSLVLLIPSCFLLLIQTNYNHKMEYNLGFLLVLFYFLISILPIKKQNRYIALTLFPLFFYLVGAYVWVFLGMYIIYCLSYEKGRQLFTYSLILLSIIIISFLVFKYFLFLQPFDQLIRYPLPFIDDSKYRFILYLLVGFMLFYPLLSKIAFSIKFKKINTLLITFFSVFFIFSATMLFLYKAYNPQTARVLRLEKMVFEEKWNEVIDFHENYPSKNMIGQYYYNIALSETDQLCNRLFFGRQDFGPNSLILPWKKEHLNWGSCFFYSVGLINEAHRWAYEEMIVYGYRPQNIIMLIKTNLINGNYRRAKKYINILNETINYKQLANEYEKLLNDTEHVRLHPELGEKIKIMPKENFFIEISDPQNNIPLLLKSNSNNKKAFEYEMSWLLLTKNVEAVVNNIKKFKDMGYTRIPIHVEEAALAYFNSTGKIPDLGGLLISHETKIRFDQYVSAFKLNRKNPSLGKENMQEKFGNTFWFYFHF